VTVELGIVLSVATALVGAAATWGSFRTRVGRLEADHKELAARTDEALRESRASSVRQGERIGELERRLAVDRAVRRATGTVSHHPATDDE
jgi:methionine aminopeptidase